MTEEHPMAQDNNIDYRIKKKNLSLASMPLVV
jgi:hypothetical protein